MANVTFDQIKSLLEQMPLEELERLREWLNKADEGNTPSDPNTGTWGAQLVAMVKQFHLGEADQWQTDDPEEWVREYRRTQTSRRNPRWSSE